MKENAYGWLHSNWRLYIPHGSDERHASDLLPDYVVSFISHMVQMKDSFCHSMLNHLIALYPTWFRWKPVLVLYVGTATSLYIPHGSDESQASDLLPDYVVSFISHMVQMKELFDSL